jgi:hypothetical protein
LGYAKEKKTEMKYEWIIFGIVVMGAITGTLILTPSFVKAQSIPTGTYETDSKLQVSNMSAVFCDYCRPFKTGFDMLGIIRNIGNTVYDNVSISAQLFDDRGRLIALENISSSAPINPDDKIPFRIFVSHVNKTSLNHYIIELNTNSTFPIIQNG